MDWMNIAGRAKNLVGKYKYVLLILLLGILLMSLPEGNKESMQPEISVPAPVYASKAEELEAILSQISGVGKVRVMLTEAAGSETIYQTDEDRSETSDAQNIRVETVIVSGSERTETGLVRTVVPPVYLGAIIVCQGGDSPAVRLSVAEAVSNVTGIGTDRITVLKMK